MSASQDRARAGAGASPFSSAGSARERVLGRVKAALGREHSEASAETGSLALVSSADTPATLNFLPENHAVVLYENQIVPHVDDVFPLLRQLSPMPRALNFVTGPSRTGDIEQTIEIGAHGPRRMHVLLLPGDAPA